MDTPKTLEQFIEDNELSMSAEPSPTNPHMADQKWEADHWAVTIQSEAGKGTPDTMQLYYSMGIGHRTIQTDRTALHLRQKQGSGSILDRIGGKNTPFTTPRTVAEQEHNLLCTATRPELEDVLDSLAMDCASVDAEHFKDWAEGMGMDSDSISALKTYQVIEEQARDLRLLLGWEAYAELLSEGVERL